MAKNGVLIKDNHLQELLWIKAVSIYFDIARSYDVGILRLLSCVIDIAVHPILSKSTVNKS